MLKKLSKLKKFRTLLALALVLCMSTVFAAGCSDPGASGGGGGGDSASSGELADLDTSKEVELVMYVVSDRPAGQDVFDNKINEILKEKLNCTLKINWIGWAEYQNKYPLLFSSGEEFDMAYCATWLNFSDLARKGAFKELGTMLPKYAPDNYKLQSETALSQATIDGKLYAVPTLLATYTAYGAIYRGDIAKEIGADFKIQSWEDVEKYCDKVKETHPEMEPIDEYSAGPEIGFTWFKTEGQHYLDNGSRFMWYDPSEEKPQIYVNYDYPKFGELLDMTARWSEKGFWSKSALSDTDSQKTQTGKAGLRVHNIDTYRDFVTQHPEFDFQWATMTKDVAHLPYTQDCMVLSNTGKNPERALAFWNLLTTNQDLYDALFYGVLGTSYELDDKGDFKMTDPDLYTTGAMWAARTNELNRNQQGTPDDYNTIREDWENNIKEGVGTERFGGFVFDPTNVQTELTACQNVYQQYYWPLELGYTDKETGLEEYKKNMEVAGVEKVVAEAQKQLDAYVDSLK
ncbi:MAG: ABC transporter substrate-binding protein [Lachnospiraceae bacterium]|nr:ABC transporter substrate-binding protein [Lachnospiraceae bacterium]